MPAKHLYISGRVQGVWYRASMKRAATSLGLLGWVRNLPDGRVEAVVQGSAEALHEIVRWCQLGPDLARVDGVEASEVPESDYADFGLRY